MPEYRIGDRSFRNRQSYEAGLRDQSRITKLQERAANTDLQGKKDILSRMEHGTYAFETILGADFIESFRDEVYRLEIAEIDGIDTFGKEKRKDHRSSEERKLEKQKKQEIRQEKKRKKDFQEYDPEMQKIILEEMKKREKKRKKITFYAFVVGVLCMGAFAFSMYMDYQNEDLQDELLALKEEKRETTTSSPKEPYEVHVKEAEEELVLEVLPEYVDLYKDNKNLIGWIKIDDTKIDYPVMAATDREYYLSHSYDDQYDKNGCIFMDPDCKVTKRSTNVILYGHNMNSGKMFGSLKKYKDYDYYKDHRYIRFDSIYETGYYEIMYAFRSKVYFEDEVTFKYYQFIDAVSEEAFYSNLEEMADISFYDTGVSAVYGDELLTLSTCDNTENNGRFVVVARRID